MPCRRRRAQLRADLIEDVAQLAKLRVVAQIERGAEIAAAEARQAAADHVHRPQHELREQHRGQHGDQQRDAGGKRRRTERIVQVAPHQRHRQADANLAERLLAERHRLRPLEVVLARVDGAQSARRAFSAISSFSCGRRGTVLPTCAGIARRDDDAGRIDDQRVDGVRGIERRLQRRLDVRAGAHVVVGRFRRRDRDGRLRIDGAAEQLEAIAALGQQHAGGVDQVQQAERDDDQAPP